MLISNEYNKINIFPKTVIEEVAQNLRMILTTYKMSVPLFREFGISASALDAPVNVQQAKMTADIVAQCKKYEPRAVIKKVLYKHNSAGNLVITLNFEVRL